MLGTRFGNMPWTPLPISHVGEAALLDLSGLCNSVAVIPEFRSKHCLKGENKAVACLMRPKTTAMAV